MTDPDDSIRRAAEEEPTVSLAGRGPTVEPEADEEPTVSLAGRDLAVEPESSATHRDAGARPESGVTGGEASGRSVPEVDAGRAVEEPAVVAGTVVAGGRVEQVEDGAAPAVPQGDLDLGGAASRTGESPDLSISGSDLDRPRIRRPAPAGTLIWVLLALLGFTLVVQLRSNNSDDGLAATRQEDLVRILSDLESEDSRLLSQIQALEQSKQELNSEVGGREAALAEAERRSQDLGLLAGTERGRGPGLDITLSNVDASDVLNTVQELRGAGGEVMQLNGANEVAVRLVASSFFVDASGGGIIADGEELTGPFHLLVIGPASTMSTALQIPGGVVASAKSGGGSVTMDSRSLVEVTAVRKAAALRYARPVS